MSSFILRRQGPVALLVLRRPPINALDREALEELGKAAEEVLMGRSVSWLSPEASMGSSVLVVTLSIGVRFTRGMR